MGIAIDATAVPARKAGAGVYITNLVKAFHKVDKTNAYFVFAKKSTIRDLGIYQAHYNLIPCSANSRILRLIWEQMILPFYLREYRIDVLHSPHYTTPLLTHNTRHVVTFHDMIFFLYPEKHGRIKRFFFRTIIPLSAARASVIIADSEGTKRDVMKLLDIPESKITVVLLAAGDKFQPIHDRVAVEQIRRKYSLPERYILYVGVLEPRKNLVTLLESYHKLLDRQVEHKLVVVGKKGWMYEEIFKTANELALASKIRFLGYVPDADLPFLYNAADLFVYPSLYEGFGLPVLEAMSCGVPVVSSNVSSIPEIVGNAGILVDPHDIDELSHAMFRVLSNIKLGQELRRRGLQRSKEFSWERTARQTLEAYEKAISSL